jgi:phage tail tape-measure protein
MSFNKLASVTIARCGLNVAEDQSNSAIDVAAKLLKTAADVESGDTIFNAVQRHFSPEDQAYVTDVLYKSVLDKQADYAAPGMVGGALTGAALGSFAGPVGTTIGAGVGGLAGGMMGSRFGTRREVTKPSLTMNGPDMARYMMGPQQQDPVHQLQQQVQQLQQQQPQRPAQG